MEFVALEEIPADWFYLVDQTDEHPPVLTVSERILKTFSCEPVDEVFFLEVKRILRTKNACNMEHLMAFVMHSYNRVKIMCTSGEVRAVTPTMVVTGLFALYKELGFQKTLTKNQFAKYNLSILHELMDTPLF